MDIEVSAVWKDNGNTLELGAVVDTWIEVSQEGYDKIKAEVDRPGEATPELTKLLGTRAPWEN